MKSPRASAFVHIENYSASNVDAHGNKGVMCSIGGLLPICAMWPNLIVVNAPSLHLFAGVGLLLRHRAGIANAHMRRGNKRCRYDNCCRGPVVPMFWRFSVARDAAIKPLSSHRLSEP